MPLRQLLSYGSYIECKLCIVQQITKGHISMKLIMPYFKTCVFFVTPTLEKEDA